MNSRDKKENFRMEIAEKGLVLVVINMPTIDILHIHSCVLL